MTPLERYVNRACDNCNRITMCNVKLTLLYEAAKYLADREHKNIRACTKEYLNAVYAECRWSS